MIAAGDRPTVGTFHAFDARLPQDTRGGDERKAFFRRTQPGGVPARQARPRCIPAAVAVSGNAAGGLQRDRSWRCTGSHRMSSTSGGDLPALSGIGAARPPAHHAIRGLPGGEGRPVLARLPAARAPGARRLLELGLLLDRRDRVVGRLDLAIGGARPPVRAVRVGPAILLEPAHHAHPAARRASPCHHTLHERASNLQVVSMEGSVDESDRHGTPTRCEPVGAGKSLRTETDVLRHLQVRGGKAARVGSGKRRGTGLLADVSLVEVQPPQLAVGPGGPFRSRAMRATATAMQQPTRGPHSEESWWGPGR